MYCKHCGARLSSGARFCARCGAQVAAGAAAPPVTTPSYTPTVRIAPRRTPGDWLLLVGAILMIFIGSGYVALTVIGRAATAQVTGYEQVMYQSNDGSTRNPNRYKLDYQFAANGQRYTGSVTRAFPRGSHMRETLSIRYLPFWPHINAEEKGIGLTGPAVLGVGVLVLAFGIRRMFRRYG